MHKSSTTSSSSLCHLKVGKDCCKNAKHGRFSYQLESARGYFKAPSFFFSIPVKSIKGRYFKSEDDSLHEIASKIDSYIERKLLLSLIFCHHCLPSYAQVFYHFFFLIVSLKGWQRLLQKRETRQIFMPTRIRSRIFQSRHVVMLDHVMLIVSHVSKS